MVEHVKHKTQIMRITENEISDSGSKIVKNTKKQDKFLVDNLCSLASLSPV